MTESHKMSYIQISHSEHYELISQIAGLQAGNDSLMELVNRLSSDVTRLAAQRDEAYNSLGIVGERKDHAEYNLAWSESALEAITAERDELKKLTSLLIEALTKVAVVHHINAEYGDTEECQFCGAEGPEGVDIKHFPACPCVAPEILKP